MKKLLSLLGSVLIAATTASSVVACGDMYNSSIDNPSYQAVDHTYDADTVAASLIARSKSLIVDDMFGFDDAITKNYALENNTIGDLVNTDGSVVNTSISDKYSSFIDDSSVANLKNLKINGTSGSIGDEGGILPFAGKAIINKLVGLIPSAPVQKAINAILPTIENALGLNGSTANISNAMKPILQAMGKLNTKVAMQGIPYALGLIPNLKKYSVVFGLVKDLLNALLSKDNVVKMDGALDSLTADADVSQYADHDLSTATDDISGLLTSIMNDVKTKPDSDKPDNKDKPKVNLFGDMLKFVSLTGMYMSFFDHGSDEDALTQMNQNHDKKIKDSVFYKLSSDGKSTVFNLAPVLNEAAYYLGNGIQEDKILNLCRILFLTSDGTTPTINKSGVITVNNLLPLINQLEGKTISSNDAQKLFTAILINKPSDVTKDLFGDKKPFDIVFNDWTLTTNDTVKKNIQNSTILQRIFLNDVSNKSSTMSLKSILEKVPLYKLLMANSKQVYDATYNTIYNNDIAQGQSEDDAKADAIAAAEKADPNPGFGEQALEKNNGILPNYAGHYTQESIADLAVDLNAMFGLNSESSTNEELKYHYFDFHDLKVVIDELLSSYNGGQSLVATLLDELGDDNIKTKFGQELGYYADVNGNINAKYVKVNSWMGHLIKALVPAISTVKPATIINIDHDDPDKSTGAEYYQDKDLSESLLTSSDSLKFFVGGLTNFVSNIMEGTDYTYWFDKVLKYSFDNVTDDPENNSVWFYGNKKRPIWEPHDQYGISTTYFDASHTLVKSMSLTIRFDLSKMPSLISMLQAKNTSPKIYTFTLSRDSVNDELSFNNAD